MICVNSWTCTPDGASLGISLAEPVHCFLLCFESDQKGFAMLCFNTRWNPSSLMTSVTAMSVLLTLISACSGPPASEQAALESLQELTPVGFKQNEAGNVIELTATDDAMTDEAVVYLQEFPELRRLHLERSAISDAALQPISKLKKLEALFLDQTAVTDQGIQQLSTLESLQQLSLVESQVGDAALPTIGELANLTMLNLSQTGVTDDGLIHLAPLKKLKSLYLGSTQLTGTGIKTLGELPELTLLDLNQTRSNDSLVAALGQFPSLEMLFLGNSRISDEQIPGLMTVLKENMPRLKGLSLKSNPLTDASISDLQELKSLKNLALVQLQNTQITKPAFKQLASVVTEVNFSVDYSERDE
ncbi:Internalin-A precursor [Gimesia chilikensis]|uniref:Internalin-A n=2 Tax=Gimesia chilikensis TaxID=2605989 RepID=A0A517W750_9PLAN|nr:Internalin-A precursor [Gimesia chilikensis]